MSITVHRAIVKLSSFLWGVYAWIAFASCALVSITAALFVPGLDRRRRWVSALGRAVFHMAGVKLTITGFEKIPAAQCIVVANHASYVDGVLLQAFLPPRFGFVIKSEVTKVPFAGFLLRRIGSEFVERFNASASARDARRLLKLTDSGEALAFFPEGTFNSEPGLGAFRAGAFAAAINSRVPVVPIVIGGTRSMLRARTMLPRYGRLTIDVLDPITTEHPAFVSTRKLAALARQRMLTVLDEPDLLQKGDG